MSSEGEAELIDDGNANEHNLNEETSSGTQQACLDEEECVCEEEEKREMATEEEQLEVNRFAHQAIARMLCPFEAGCAAAATS